MTMTNKELSKAIEATLKGVVGFGSLHPTYVASLSHLKALHLEQLKRACLTPQLKSNHRVPKGDIETMKRSKANE